MSIEAAYIPCQDLYPCIVRLVDIDRLLIRSAMSQMQLSARACRRILKLARTIADLDSSEAIQLPYLA